MNKQSGFTLLELLVTSGITALLMLAVSSLFITFMATAYKSRMSQNLRESGGSAMRKIVDMVRSASELTSYCSSDLPLDYITLTGADGLSSTIKEENDRIASVSALSTYYLTPESQNSDYLSNLSFHCYPNDEGKKYIEINFTLHLGSSETSNNVHSTTLDFSSGVATRN